MFRLFFIIILLSSSNALAYCFATQSEFVDTIYINSPSVTVLHYKQESKEIENKMYSMVEDDLIFSNSFNHFSKLKIYHGSKEIELSTIPLDNIIILENKHLILGISKVALAPYNIVIYSFDGTIIYKMALPTLSIKITLNRMRDLIDVYPELRNCIEKDNSILYDGQYCYLSLSNRIRRVLEARSIESVFNSEEIVGNPYFNFEISTTNKTNAFGYKFKRNKGGYNATDPFFDLMCVDRVPYLLILNDENGNKVNLPLVSNFNLFHKLK